MFDSQLLFHNAVALTTNGDSASLDLGKTAADGQWIEIAVTVVGGTGTPTINFKVQESNDDSSYNDDVVFPAITAVGNYYRKVQSDKRYLRLNRTVSGTTPSFTVTAGPVSYPEKQAVV